jgi:carboxylesterase type B
MNENIQGLPFATPPIDELRFAPPKEIAPWHPRILNATRYQHACMSNTTQTSSPQKDISEDCLYLNIFADRRCMASLFLN